MIKAFCTHIANGLALGIGSTLFAGARPPDAADLCSVVLEQAGEFPNASFPNQTAFHFQIVTRGHGYFDARDESKRILAWLIGRDRNRFRNTNITLTGESGDVWTNCTFSQVSGGYIGTDEWGRHLFSLNIAVHAKKGS